MTSKTNDSSFIVRAPSEDIEKFNKTVKRMSENRAELIRKWMYEYIEENKEETIMNLTIGNVSKGVNIEDRILESLYENELLKRDAYTHPHSNPNFVEVDNDEFETGQFEVQDETGKELYVATYELDKKKRLLRVELEEGN